EEFKTGEQVSATLNAEQQLPWYNMFTEIYADIEGKNFQLFENYRTKLFDECYSLSYSQPVPKIKMPPHEYGPDTQEIYVSKINLPDSDVTDERLPPAPCVHPRSPSHTHARSQPHPHPCPRPYPDQPTAGPSGTRQSSPHTRPEPRTRSCARPHPDQPTAGPSGTRHSSPLSSPGSPRVPSHSGNQLLYTDINNDGMRGMSTEFEEFEPRQVTPDRGRVSDRPVEELVFTDPSSE
ncbi:hypothetical protein FRC11_011990, partial [Ceratobasidium sp. 423]